MLLFCCFMSLVISKSEAILKLPSHLLELVIIVRLQFSQVCVFCTEMNTYPINMSNISET